MPIKMFKCAYCNEMFSVEIECLEHEQTHAQTIECKHVAKKQETAAVCNLLQREDEYEFTFVWQNKTRQVSQKFVFNKSVINIESIDLTEAIINESESITPLD